MRRLLSRVIANRRWVETYRRLRAFPGIGPAIRWVSRLVLPVHAPRWVEIQSGVGRGLFLQSLPRFELAYVRGDHETVVQDLLSAWLRPRDIFFDVGAHVGFFSLIAGRLVGPEGTVLAFEPDPDNLTRLEAGIVRNRMEWIRANSVVVSDDHGKVWFARSSPASSGMEGRVVEGDVVSSTGRLVVQAVTLDDYFSTRAGVVKIDVEGGEIRALKGASHLLRDGNLRWIVEAHTEEIEAAIVPIFRNTGYRLRVISALRSTSASHLSGRYVIAEPDGQDAASLSPSS